MRAAMVFGNFQIINIYIIQFIKRYLKVLGQRVNKFHLNECRDA